MVIIDPLSTNAFVSLPLNVMVVSLEWPTSLSNNFPGLGLVRRLSPVCPSTETPSSLKECLLVWFSVLLHSSLLYFDFDFVSGVDFVAYS